MRIRLEGFQLGLISRRERFESFIRNQFYEERIEMKIEVKFKYGPEFCNGCPNLRGNGVIENPFGTIYGYKCLEGLLEDGQICGEDLWRRVKN